MNANNNLNNLEIISKSCNLAKKNFTLITGASRGIGKACAYELAKAGKNLILISRNTDNTLEDISTELTQCGILCIYFTCDITDFNSLKCLKDQLSKLNLSVDSIINNAGISKVGLFQDMSNEEWDEIISSNLSSVFYVTKLFIDDMLKEHFGKIINISSVWGNVGASCEVAYSATKGGVNSFTRALAKELAPSNISVNAIACGAIDTTMNNHLTIEEKQSLAEEIPFGRMGTPDEVANLVLKLLDSTNYLTGQIITLDGGWT